MNESPKRPSDKNPSSDNIDKDRWQYYYDDAHGYEIFIDDEVDDDKSDDIVTTEPGGNG